MATKATVLKDKDGTSLYPVTDVSLVVGLQEGAIMESVVVSELPTADATTVGKVYMIPSATVTGEYDRYMTTYSNSAYTWTQLGSTAIPSPVIADNLTTNDATQALSAKQGKVLNDNMTQLGQKVGEQQTIVLDSDVDATRSAFTYLNCDFMAGIPYDIRVVVTSSLNQTLSLWDGTTRLNFLVDGSSVQSTPILPNSVLRIVPTANANKIGLWTNTVANSEHIEITQTGFGITEELNSKASQSDLVSMQTKISGEKLEFTGAGDTIQDVAVTTEVGKTYLLALTPWNYSGVSDDSVIFIVQDSTYTFSPVRIVKGESLPPIVSFVALTTTMYIRLRASSGEPVAIYFGDSTTVELALSELYEKTNESEENRERISYLDWSHSYYGELLKKYTGDKMDVISKSSVIANRHKTPVFQADFSSQEAFEADFKEDSVVSQSSFPNVISRPLSQAVVVDGSLYLKNTLDDEETESKGIPRFYCANAVLKETRFPYGVVTPRGMISADFRISQAPGVNNSIWGNAPIDNDKGKAYFEETYPDAVAPEDGYMAEVDVNEGKYPNIVSMSTHCWHKASLDSSVNAGSIASGSNYPEINGVLLNRYQYNIHLAQKTQIKVLKLTLRKVGFANMHISKVFLYENGIPCRFPDVLNNIASAYASSLNAKGVVNSITYDNSGTAYGAEHICDDTTGTEAHYVTNSDQDREIVITFKNAVSVSDIIVGTGWGIQRTPTDGKIVLSYKATDNAASFTELYNNGIDVKVLSDVHNYKFVWDENKLYWLLDNIIIREADNRYVNRIPQIKLSTMAASFAGTVTEAIDGTYMQVLDVGVYI